ncbi:gametocyte-specific factor 1 homolog [Rhipicephalus sanguineus]|uniref:gametocyte-specific factor 1 homolog n=1 Tax=Rhipicephalus sanguineus TaxID=34632 RepID=UPI0018940E7D|nr:gametocyte-specific factor 1 homolog [Rhipicephalus sanguineus]
MATYRTFDDGLVSCPLRPDHKVKRSRLSLHVSKCQAGDRRRLVKPCPFNSEHDAPDHGHEYYMHLMTCPDRSSSFPSASSRDCYDPPYEVPFAGGARPLVPEPKEKWDLESGPTSDPYKPAVPPIFRPVHGLKRSERRRFYKSLLEEVQRTAAPGPTTRTKSNTPDFEKRDTGSSSDEEEQWD